MKILLEEVYKKTITFLNKAKAEYIVIGGIAAGTLGEPRVTADVDVDILLNKDDISDFLNKAKRAGFKINERRCAAQAKNTGAFQIGYGEYHIDFIIASTDLEREAFKRKKTISLYGLKACFPTPEDLILLKIIPGRPQDLLDAGNVALRYKGKLDTKYLTSWAQQLSEQAEDMRIFNELKKLL